MFKSNCVYVCFIGIIFMTHASKLNFLEYLFCLSLLKWSANLDNAACLWVFADLSFGL